MYIYIYLQYVVAINMTYFIIRHRYAYNACLYAP